MATTSASTSRSERSKEAWKGLSGRTAVMWDDFCDNLEADDSPEWLQWFSLNVLRRLSIEAPVVVSFVFACTFMHFFVSPFLPHGSIFLGVDDFFAPLNPLHYIRQITHIFMHEDHDGWKAQHLRNNMTHMLLVGPSSEAVFGSLNLIYIILIVAISSAWAHILIGQHHTRQLGASGVCFALILLNSLVSAKRGKLPVSFVLTAIWWLGDELFDFFLAGDGVSHHAHLVGGIVGAALGYHLRQDTTNIEGEKVVSSSASSSQSATTPTKTQAGAIANEFKNLMGFVGRGRDRGRSNPTNKNKKKN